MCQEMLLSPNAASPNSGYRVGNYHDRTADHEQDYRVEPALPCHGVGRVEHGGGWRSGWGFRRVGSRSRNGNVSGRNRWRDSRRGCMQDNVLITSLGGLTVISAPDVVEDRQAVAGDHRAIELPIAVRGQIVIPG